MNAKKFGQFICTLRQEKGLTQKELADKIGVTDKAVSRWETGKNYPDFELFESIARELGVTVNEMISCRCLGTDEILPESDKNIVRIIKINRRQKRSFSIILAMLLVFILISGLYTYGRLSGLDGRAVNRTYDIYQRDLTAVLMDVKGRVMELAEEGTSSTSSASSASSGTLFISDADIFFSDTKEICSSRGVDTRLTLYSDAGDFVYDISVYPPQRNSALPGGENNLGLDILRYRRSASLNSDEAVSLTCLFQVIEALDINALLSNQTEISFFNLRYCGVRNGKDMDLAVNSAVDYIFDGCSIRSVMSDEEFSGSYALFYLSGFAPSDDGNGYSANDNARAFIGVPQWP